MRITKNDIPIKIDLPGAVVRRKLDFGDPSAFSTLEAEHFSFAAGTDVAPLLKGLTDDACQSPHWGFMISGRLVVDYTDGSKDTCNGQDLFYWPAGHSVRVEDDAELVVFSPQVEHGAVLDHILAKTGG